MSKISIKSTISILISKLVLNISKGLFKGGSNFPGRVALKLDNNILKTVASNYNVILVTGTNGKTTTTSMIYNILKKSGKKVITNSTGANMLPGIVACFVNNYHFSNNEKKYAVIEVDEANVKFITSAITPKIITITNLFRDQLDRYGEVYTTLNKILEGLKNCNGAKLVLNGDESLLGELSLKNDICYYGFGTSINSSDKIDINADAKFCKKCQHPYEYNFITYNHLGDFYCPNCGYKRAELKYKLDSVHDLTPYNSAVSINGNDITIGQPGVYNIYNGLCAYAICKELGIEESVIGESLKNQDSHFGRQESINIEGKEAKIILVKNPAGYNQAIDTIAIDKRSMSIAFLLNDNYADGRDVSWIWDVNFEKINTLDVNDVIIGGIRLYDMAIRLKIAGFNEDQFHISSNFEDILNSIKNSSGETVYILATYTAMIDFRKFLNSKGYIKKLW
ncbi:Mur ligase family protein [Clostridium sp. 19966]|uniref:Mur ligase family protein n=1 Tax=Clostridium sp. 19966 TaxID=2768166 RepID=UPI0028DF59BF|nr:Mur ligase family protein [Clostridium sp. 19966]MDT8719093.1 Mur ligase family protein [Clostridium sp. 19966]